MDISTYLGNKILDHMLRNQAYTPPAAIYLAAHTADPGLTGASEVAGSGYSRQALSLAAASAKTAASSAQVQITMPSSGGPFNIPYLGIWDASTAGNFLWRLPILGTNFEVTAATTDVIEAGQAHGFAADDRVVFEDIGGGLPTGLAAGTVYYVLASGLTSSQFKVSTTSGGSAVDVTAAGGAIVRKVLLQQFNANNIVQVGSGQLTVGC